MAADEKTTPPAVMWAQSRDKIYLTINLEDCKSPDIQLSEKALKFSGRGGPDNKMHEVELEFYGEIDVEKSKKVVLSRHIPMALMRKEEGPYWPRLLKSSQKMHWLKTDFDKWRDEDEEPEDNTSWNMEDIMANFDPNEYKPPSGPNGMPDMGEMPPEEDDADSDDEDLPDLENPTP